MAPRKRKRYNEEYYKARTREVRDLYNKLRKKYKPEVVDQFFRENYFIQPGTIDWYMRQSDNQPVNLSTASIIYKTAIQDNFHL